MGVFGIIFGSAALVTTGGLIWMLGRWDAIGPVLLFGVVVLEAVSIRLPAVDVGLLISPIDVVAIALFAATLLRLRRLATPEGLWLGVFACLLLISFVRGSQSYGVKSAGVEVRSYFYFLSACLYASTSRTGRGALTVMQVAAAVLVALALFRWIATGLHLGIASTWSEVTVDSPLRVLNASQALLLLAVGMLSLAETRAVRALAVFLLGLVCCACVVLLQHRTVWVVAAIWAAAILLWSRRRGRALRGVLALGVVGGLLTVAVFGTNLVELRSSMEESATSAVNVEEGTFAWRVESWKVLLRDSFSSPERIVVGQPFGAGFGRVLFGTFVEASPHSHYVQTYLRTGLLGLCAFILAYLTGARRLLGRLRDEDALGIPLGAWLLILLGQLVYYSTYSPSIDQGFLFGMSLACWRWKGAHLGLPEYG